MGAERKQTFHRWTAQFWACVNGRVRGFGEGITWTPRLFTSICFYEHIPIFLPARPPDHSAVFPSFTPVDKRREERGNPDTHWVYYIINSFSIFINNK